MYNPEHSFYSNPLNCFAFGTEIKSLNYNDDVWVMTVRFDILHV